MTVEMSAGANSEDVKGPHAALAVRLQQRDPGRSFVLGERLQYVLLPGFRTQARTLLCCSV
jgi:DNA polymerase delta subunit 1